MQQNNSTTDLVLLLQQRLPERPIIVLCRQPDLNSHVLDIQDYVIDGESIIPLFSSPEALRASTRGADLGRPLFEIDRALLTSVAKGHEVYLLDPQTDRQLRFSARDLLSAFPEPFVPE
jgi:hypothetical protein